jgi:hypothetical protein
MSQTEEPKAELVVAGDDWERFLSALENFMSLQQKTLQRLKELNNRNQALRQELRDAINLQKMNSQSAEIGQDQLFKKAKYDLGRPRKTRLGFLGNFSRLVRFESRRPSQALNSIGAYASCEKCGYQIKRPSRFCEGCGGDFGALMCSCGRDLKPGDKFCDRCDRTL